MDIFGIQRQPLFAAARCVVIDVKGAGRFFGEKLVLSLLGFLPVCS